MKHSPFLLVRPAAPVCAPLFLLFMFSIVRVSVKRLKTEVHLDRVEKLSRLFQLREKLGLRDQGVFDSRVVEGIFFQNIRFLVKIFSTY